ncbi:CD209 antigen-like protein C DC-SIGN-related protein 2 [Channa argus]|uniref:CD209 antigen-like protein C DC-SIGN-related protein 2 n=1 Tax=Channa argus TaxID=215402 RepID=A0A6G1PW89_CHAAH|nr:CD209 antigen-like protein C DC-SIGN-related protein 2 [Channa argus]
MEEIYANVEYDKSVNSKPSTDQTAPRSSERRFHGAVVLCLGLLSVVLLAGLISLGVHYHYSVRVAAPDLSTIEANLTELLQDSKNKVSSLAAEKNQLNASLIEKIEELNRLQSLSKQKKTCPAGWTIFSSSCYFLSSDSGSWTRGSEDCRNRAAHLVVIKSDEEQKFISELTNLAAWIGLTDKEEEGTWKWIDGTALILNFWNENQPDDGGIPKSKEEDCAHVKAETAQWNDLPCETPQRWICEKKD